MTKLIKYTIFIPISIIWLNYHHYPKKVNLATYFRVQKRIFKEVLHNGQYIYKVITLESLHNYKVLGSIKAR